MPRAGRSLELLVKALEQLLAQAPVEIRSPDYIIGKNTKIRREVDVSLRSQIGSVHVLVIIECRDRIKSQDVTWIEQLASKREDVEADKAVAISASGFSSGARNLARSNQVELRSLEELEPETIFDWLSDQTIGHRTRYVDVVGVSINMADQLTEANEAQLASILDKINQLRIPDQGLRQDSKMLVQKSDYTLVSIEDVLFMMPSFGPRFDARFPNLPPREKKRTALTVDFGDAPQFAVALPDGLCDINSIEIDGNFYYDEHPVPIRRYLYRTESGTITENAEAVIESGESRVTLGFHATPDGKTMGISLNSAGRPAFGEIDLSFDTYLTCDPEG